MSGNEPSKEYELLRYLMAGLVDARPLLKNTVLHKVLNQGETTETSKRIIEDALIKKEVSNV